MPNLLCIETSIGKCSVALKHNNSEDYIEAKQSFMQSELLFVLIQKILKRNQINYKDLDTIACTIGPGSFTGIRIGIAAARGIKKALPNIQLIGVSTLEVMANDFQLPATEKKILTILNASSEDLYAQEFYSSSRNQIEAIYLLQEEKLEDKRKNALLVTEQSSFYHEQSFIVNLTAKSLLHKVLKIIAEEKQEAYKNIQPIYIKSPNITTKTAL